MKKLILFSVLLTSISVFASPEPPVLVMQSFEKTFAAATETKWSDLTGAPNKFYQVFFKQNGIQIRAQYTPNGVLVGTIRYYGKENLLPIIVSKLSKKYSTAEIMGVTEVATEIETRYLITLHTEKFIYTVKTDNLGNIELLNKIVNVTIK